MHIDKAHRKRGSSITKIGPFCFKRYGRHKRAPEKSPVLRLKREIIGSMLFASSYVQVAEPLIWSEQGSWLLRRWVSGCHPCSEQNPRESDQYALGNWIAEHRGLKSKYPFTEDSNLTLLTHFSLLGLAVTNPLAVFILNGNDLLHGDLVAENIVLTRTKPGIIDNESVCIGNLAWDAAQLIAYTLRATGDDSASNDFYSLIELNEEERYVACALVRLMITMKK